MLHFCRYPVSTKPPLSQQGATAAGGGKAVAGAAGAAGGASGKAAAGGAAATAGSKVAVVSKHEGLEELSEKVWEGWHKCGRGGRRKRCER